MREQVEVLEHHADVAAHEVDLAVRVGDVLALDEDAAGRGLLEAVDAAQEGGLAGPGRSDHADHLTRFDPEIDSPEDLEVAEGLVESIDFDGRDVSSDGHRARSPPLEQPGCLGQRDGDGQVDEAGHQDRCCVRMWR